MLQLRSTDCVIEGHLRRTVPVGFVLSFGLAFLAALGSQTDNASQTPNAEPSKTTKLTDNATTSAITQRSSLLTPEQQEVWNVSQTWLDAFNRRDLDTFSRYIADDFIGSTDDGILTTKAFAIKRLSRPAEDEQRKNVQDVNVRRDGDTAVVNYLVTSEEGFGSTKIIAYFRRTEIFRKKNGTWIAIAAHESPVPVNFRKPLKTEVAHLKDYIGQYEWPRPGMLDIYTVENDRLMSDWNGHKAESFLMGNDTFFVHDDVGITTFERDAQGRITGYVYHFPDGQEIRAKKIR